MPEGYVIDANRKLIHSRAWGVFSNEDLQEHYRRMTADSAFDSHYAQLADLSEVTEFLVDSALIESVARKKVFAPGAVRAFIAPKGVGYGLARMFAAYAPADQKFRVFDQLADAEAWLAASQEG